MKSKLFVFFFVAMFAITGTAYASGYMASDKLWIKAVINTVDGPIDGVFYKGGEKLTSRGDKVIWGYFYADPADVSWGDKGNPDLYVKIWFDISGRIDVNFFHVSVPDIEVYTDYPYNKSYDKHGTATMDNRYIRHEFEKSESTGSDDPLLAKTELLKGSWHFYYTITSSFDHYYHLDDIDGYTNDEGGYYIWGTDEFGDLVVAGYNPDNKWWSLLDPSIDYDRFYVFYTDGNTILEDSCYFRVNPNTHEMSNCYSLHGKKLSFGSRRVSMGKAEMNVTGASEDEETSSVENNWLGEDGANNRIFHQYLEMKRIADQ